LETPANLVEQVVPLAGHDLSLLRPRDSEALLDEHAFADDEFLPYWADLWPSAELLARTVITRSLRGARVLELGCGLGLPSLAAALAGGRVLATDWSAQAVEAVRLNAERNQLTLETLVCAWQEPDDLLARGPWDLVLAADVLYERRNVAALLDLLTRLGCETWLADPGRAPADTLLADLELAGWTRREQARTAKPRVTVHRLFPPAQ
jgi:predicted nicotinamide N-methyase